MQNPSIDLKRGAEGARYALLRRLAPAILHQIAGSFQPVIMMSAIIEKRVQAAAPDLAALAKTSKNIGQFATAATRSNLDLIGWIAPQPQSLVPLDAGVQQSLHLVATELSFRGFKCLNQTQDVAVEVALSHVRGVFVAALLALTDSAAIPSTVLVTAQLVGMDLVVTIALTDANATTESAAVATGPHEDFDLRMAMYRKIEWADVEAMAAADGVVLQHSPQKLVLRLPTATATATLSA